MDYVDTFMDSQISEIPLWEGGLESFVRFCEPGGGACGRISQMGSGYGRRVLSEQRGVGSWVGHCLWQACKVAWVAPAQQKETQAILERAPVHSRLLVRLEWCPWAHRAA